VSSTLSPSFAAAPSILKKCEKPEMSEKIGVTYRPIYVGGVHTGGYHMALFYDKGKEAKVIEVGPSTPPPGPISAVKSHRR
jgi:hypothetical protein